MENYDHRLSLSFFLIAFKLKIISFVRRRDIRNGFVEKGIQFTSKTIIYVIY